MRPELVIRAELGGWTRDGMVRQTAFKGMEPGRDPKTVVRETAVATTTAVRAAEAAEPERPRQGDPGHGEGRDVRRVEGRRGAKARGQGGEGRPIPPTSPELAATDEELAALDALGKEGAVAGRRPTSSS